MKGRTYRYYNGKVQYPFGFSLSYTSFAYDWQMQPKNVQSLNDTIRFSVKVKNTGNYDGDEVAQVYVHYPSIDRMPVEELKAFRKIHLNKNNEAVAEFKIPVAELKKWDMEKHTWKLYSGNYTFVVGSNSSDQKLTSVISVAVNGKR